MTLKDQSPPTISAHTPGPWKICRLESNIEKVNTDVSILVRQRSFTGPGPLLGVADRDGRYILDPCGNVWRSGAEKSANTQIRQLFDNEYLAVVRAKTPEAQRRADERFLRKVNAYLAIKDAEREAAPVDAISALTFVMADDNFEILEDHVQRLVRRALGLATA